MPTFALEWLHLAARWIHVIAAIMWIGDSFLFMWMDRALVPPSRPREGAVAGEMWMVHSGGFYEVVKRKVLAPGEMPKTLHWFMWEAYTTWISFGAAAALSLALLVLGWLVYDALWRSALGRRPALAAAISFALLIATAWGLTHVYSGRA